MIRRWDFIFSLCGGTSMSAQRATLATRLLHESEPISNQPVGLESPHCAHRYQSGGPPFGLHFVGVVEI